MNSGIDFENYVQYVYHTLLNLRGENIQVSRRTTFVLASGETYEIDVYYEFIKAGLRHRVAIECKDWSRAVDQGQILEFHHKIKNISDDIVGVVVSRKGFQEGAENVARRHGILLLTKDTLPSILNLMGQKIVANAIHEPNLIGEPFWVIAELSNDKSGNSTGTYYALPENSHFKFPLFLSKFHALSYMDRLPDKQKWGVFGLPQYKLRVLIGFMELSKLRLAIVFDMPLENGDVKILPVEINADKLRREYLI